MEYITKKLPRSINGKLRKLQARYQLRTQKRISEGVIVERALESLEHHPEHLFGVEKKGSILDIIGIDKSRKKSDVVKELDEVLYGDVP